MKGKKLVTLVVTAALVFGSSVPAFAEKSTNSSKPVVVSAAEEQSVKISKEDAKTLGKKILKEYFDTEVDDKSLEGRIELRSSDNYREKSSGNKKKYIWDLSWYSNSSETNININLSLDAMTGKLLNIGKYEYTEGQQNVVTVTEDQARKVAEDFLKKVCPDEFKEVKEFKQASEYYYGRDMATYTFNYSRMINNVLFRDNGLTIQVNGATGKVMSYNCNWSDNINAPAADGVISQQKAEEIFANSIDFKLNYRQYRDKYSDGKNNNMKIIYSPSFSSGAYVDAKTGKITDENNVSKIVTKELTDAEREAFYKNAKEVKTLSKEIDRNRAQAVINDYMKSFYGEVYSIDQLNYQENTDKNDMWGRKTWSAEFNKKDSNGKVKLRGNVTVDALTEGIICIDRYYMDENDAKFKAAVSWEDAYTKAINAIAKYCPDKIKNIQTLQTKYTNVINREEVQDRFYNFAFMRRVNGIAYQDNNINVEVDAKTGEIRSLRVWWNPDTVFPESKGIITIGEAKKIFFEHAKPQLMYINVNKNGDYENPDYETRLVYGFGFEGYDPMASNVDAFTGKRLNYEGEEIDENLDLFRSKIKGSTYEKELTIMGYQGVIDTKNFEINMEISIMDLIKILVNAKGYRPYMLENARDLKMSGVPKSDANYKYLQMAVAYGIVEDKAGEFNVNEKVTREDMTKAIIKFLKYDKLAQSTDIFAPIFADAKDINPANVGYAAIAKGLGIIQPENGKFRPKDNATMVEMAVAVYRAMVNMRSN